MTIVERIIAAHAQRDQVSPGDMVVAEVDRVYIQDGNTPTIARIFEEYGFDRVRHPERVGVFFDHAVLAANALMSARLREAERFARRLGLRVFRAGSGISHQVAIEEGWYEPGSLVVGADSHTCTGGVLQCLALGMGASDVAAAMVTGRVWLRVPETRWVVLRGRPDAAARSKDVVLHLAQRFGADTFLYQSVEWCGPWVEELSFDAAAVLANMSVDLGAKCSFLPPGPGRREGLVAPAPPAARGRGDEPAMEPVIEIDLDGLPPHIARPHDASQAVPIDECAGQPIDYVFVGTCTNGRLEDLREVARVVKGRQIAPGVHCVVTPASRTVYQQAMHEGIIDALMSAGAIVTPPGCGACVGTQGTIPADGDAVFSTMNRNFRGRMGNPKADIWLGSPLVAAHVALTGRIPRLEDLDG